MDIFTGHQDWTMEILEDGTFGVLEYHGNDTVVTVPYEVCGTKVTKICDEALSTWKEDISYEMEFKLLAIEKVIIPDTVTTIGFHSFDDACDTVQQIMDSITD